MVFVHQERTEPLLVYECPGCGMRTTRGNVMCRAAHPPCRLTRTEYLPVGTLEAGIASYEQRDQDLCHRIAMLERGLRAMEEMGESAKRQFRILEGHEVACAARRWLEDAP